MGDDETRNPRSVPVRYSFVSRTREEGCGEPTEHECAKKYQGGEGSVDVFAM